MPRNNELGGYFGQGVIVKTYTRGQTFNALVRITANHMGGRFEFKVCNLDVDTKESDACFDKNGVFTYTLTSTASQDFVFPVTLPNITCKRCVLQWTYIVGQYFILLNDWRNFRASHLYSKLLGILSRWLWKIGMWTTRNLPYLQRYFNFVRIISKSNKYSYKNTISI